MITCFSAASVFAAMLCSAIALYIQSAALKRRTKCSLCSMINGANQHGQDHRRQRDLRRRGAQDVESGPACDRSTRPNSPPRTEPARCGARRPGPTK